MACSTVQRGNRLRVRGIRVPDRCQDPAPMQSRQQTQPMVFLGREIHDAYPPELSLVLEETDAATDKVLKTHEVAARNH